MSIRIGSILGAAVITIAAILAWHSRPAPEAADAVVQPVVERTRDQLELRDGQLFEPDGDQAFAGLLVEFYPDAGRKVAIEIRDGKPHGLSRGWYRNGQLEVEEQFVAGVAHGPRTRWHPNGLKRSEAQIEHGQITGTYVQWHDNGRKAAEATIVNGQPDGICRGWHPSGNPKSCVELRAGEVVSREYWEDQLGTAGRN